MPIKTIIAKNITGLPVVLPELGVTIAGGASFSLSTFFRLEEIQESATLGTLITTAKVIINDGVIDLSLAQSLNYVTPPISDKDVDAQLNAASATPAANALVRYTATGGLTLRETGGPTNLTFGAIADGQLFSRSGTTIVGVAAAVLTASAPVDVTKAAAAVGVATSAARADHKHNVATAAPTVGIGGTNAEGASTSLARADHDHLLRETGGPTELTIGAVADGQRLVRSGSTIVGAGGPGTGAFFASVSSAVAASTTSTTDVLLDSMTLTPGSGTYLIFASAQVGHSLNGVTSLSIYVGGVLVAASTRDFTRSINSTGQISLLCSAAVGAAQAVEIRYKSSSATQAALANNRALAVLKV